MAWTRASQLDRTLQCLASTYLWNTVPSLRLQPKSDSASLAADWGTMVHHWKETGEIVGSESHVKTFNKKLAILEQHGISRLDIWPDSGYHEVAVAYHCEKGIIDILHDGNKEVKETWKLAHSLPWVTGTLDYYDVTDRLVVDDLKTGMLFDKSADEIAQTYFYLMVLNKIYRKETNAVSSITHWPKYPLDSLPNRDPGQIPVELLDQFEELLKKTYETYKTNPKQFRAGPECEWCPVKKAGICELQGAESEASN